MARRPHRQANYALLDVTMLLRRFPSPAAATATATTSTGSTPIGADATGAPSTPAAPTPADGRAPLAAARATHHFPNPPAHQPNPSSAPRHPPRDTALASLQLALLDLFPDPPGPTACPDPTSASASTSKSLPLVVSAAAFTAWQERQLEARAKRAAAEVLALREPLQHKHVDPARVDTPCEELWSRLCEAVAKRLGGRRPARGLKAMLLEEQHVFRIMQLVGGAHETGAEWC